MIRDAPGEGPPSIIAELVRQNAAEDTSRATEAQERVAERLSWHFSPGFLLLPLAPLQTGVGLAGAGSLAAGFAVTYPFRIVAGAAGAAACAATGSGDTAGEVWGWGWDSKKHARFWGVHPQEGGSSLDRCVGFALDYSRYSLSPVLPGRPAAPAAATEAGTGHPVQKVDAPPAIRALGATVRAKRSDAVPLVLTVPLDAPTVGAVIVPIGEAIQTFCHDDELSFEVVAVLDREGNPGVSGAYSTRVSRWREPGGPRIRWLAPPEVVVSGTKVNRVSTRELPVRILLRADTADAPITLWQIKQDGKVRGGAFATRGHPSLGRAITASPEAPVEFKAPGDRTTLEVVVEAGESRKASSTAAFVFSPGR